MNFLAHSYLSFNHREILVGNMISDFVKGKKKFEYQQEIQNGIALHRRIDSFTDAHQVTKEAAKFLKPAVGLYSGAFIDVVYDHFLANDTHEFTDNSLLEHTIQTYHVLSAFNEILPEKFQILLPYMKTQNWLYNYKNIAGIQNSFSGVVKRASYLHSSSAVFDLFQQHYHSLQKCYNNFFPDLKEFSILQFKQMTC